jgi:hypothetical protein
MWDCHLPVPVTRLTAAKFAVDVRLGALVSGPFFLLVREPAAADDDAGDAVAIAAGDGAAVAVDADADADFAALTHEVD